MSCKSQITLGCSCRNNIWLNQSFAAVFQYRWSWKFCNIHTKTPVLESLFNRVTLKLLLRFSTDIVFSSLVPFAFCLLVILFIFFLKLKTYILIHIRLCRWVGDKNILTWPISRNKTTFLLGLIHHLGNPGKQYTICLLRLRRRINLCWLTKKSISQQSQSCHILAKIFSTAYPLAPSVSPR